MSDMSQDLRRRIASVVNAFDESLAAAGVPRLTEDQKAALKAVLELLYARAREETGQGGKGRRSLPPLVG